MAEVAGVGRRIVVPLDGSDLGERALPWVLALAEPKAEVVLFRAVPEAEPIRGLLGNIEQTAEQVTERYRTIARQDLAQAAGQLRGESAAAGLTVVEVVETGLPTRAILATVVTREADLVVMASHGRGAAGRLAFGSVADELVRASPIPVVVIRPTEDEEGVAPSGPAKIGRVVVPLDGSDLARRALPIASGLATRLGVPLRLVTAVELPRAGGSMAGLGLEPGFGAGSEELYARMQAEATQILEEMRRGLGVDGTAIETEVLAGNPADAIIQDAGAADVVVMTSRGRGGVERLLLGSVAEKLVRSGRGPVLLVPAGRSEDEETG